MVIETVLPAYTEIKQTIKVVKRYFATFRILGVRSSKSPNNMFPNANMILTIATSNHKESVVHICFLFFFDLILRERFYFIFVPSEKEGCYQGP